MTNEPFTEETTGQIDPQNPFDNALENAAYRTDYRRFLPQICCPAFRYPCSRSVTSAGTFAAR